MNVDTKFLGHPIVKTVHSHNYCKCQAQTIKPVKFVLTMTRQESLEIAKVLKSHPLGIMNICTKLHGNPVNPSRDVLLKATNINLIVAL